MTTMEIREPMSSSDARDAILSRHDQLRGLVSETIHCADDAAHDAAYGVTTANRAFEPLRMHARELYEAFQSHMDLEERILATALRDVIGWGSVLQAQIEENHEKQRAILASALSALEPEGSPAQLVESVLAVADSLLEDLKTEETFLLNADIDAIASDSQGG